MKYHSKMAGVTLIETMLVAIIGLGILSVGLVVYQTYQRDIYVRQIQYNVDTLFQAMTLYYRANCNGNLNATGAVTPASLNPNANPDSLFPINVQTDLINTGYVQTSTNELQAGSPYVDSTTGYQGYITQFNREPDALRYQCTKNVSGQPATGPASSQNCTAASPIAHVVIWRAQVAVHVKSTQNAAALAAILGGQCLSDISQGVVRPCSSSTGKGSYIVWERAPSQPAMTFDQNSSYWETNPNTLQFKQMYNTYPTEYLLEVGPNGVAGPTAGTTSTQYILCGS